MDAVFRFPHPSSNPSCARHIIPPPQKMHNPLSWGQLFFSCLVESPIHRPCLLRFRGRFAWVGQFDPTSFPRSASAHLQTRLDRKTPVLDRPVCTSHACAREGRKDAPNERSSPLWQRDFQRAARKGRRRVQGRGGGERGRMKDAIPNFDAFIGGFPLFAYFCKRSLSDDHDRSRRIADFDHETSLGFYLFPAYRIHPVGLPL